VLAPEIGDIDFPARAVEQYRPTWSRRPRSEDPHARGSKLVLDLSYGAASFRSMAQTSWSARTRTSVVNPFAADRPG